MIVLTCVTFAALLVILSKYAWRPILTALDAREEMIRKSVIDAQETREKLDHAREECDQMIAQAQLKSRQIVEQSRKAAIEAARVIEEKARDEVQIMLENARSEIKFAKEKAQAELKEGSAELAIELAEKIVQENLKNATNREFINRLIKKI